MKTMVFAVPATEGGALTILNHYYEKAVSDVSKDWVFVVSKPKFPSQSNITVLNYPWVKKSWIHRYYFDHFMAPKIVAKFNVDEILSLQNVLIPRVKISQTLYLHQILPFLKKRFRITESLRFWMYQNVLSRLIFKSVKKADRVIVQTKWFMDTVTERLNIEKNKFIISQPELNVNVRKTYDNFQNDPKTFFYPSGSMMYKNHVIVAQACRSLKSEGVKNYRVILTLAGNENRHIRKIHRMTKREDLPINFIGTISLDQVYEYYAKSILIFPSYIETFGLPLLEARMHGTPILASDCAFSHEILDDYHMVHFFDPFDARQLAELMKASIKS